MKVKLFSAVKKQILQTYFLSFVAISPRHDALIRDSCQLMLNRILKAGKDYIPAVAG